MIFSDKKIEDNLKIIVSKINEVFTREQRDINIVTENLLKLDERLKLIEQKVPEIARLDTEVISNKNRLDSLRNSMIELSQIVSEIDSGLNEEEPVEEEKPKFLTKLNPDKIKVIPGRRGRPRKVPFINDYREPEEEKPVLPGEITAFCPRCRTDKKMVGAEVEETNFGPMWKGKCVTCNASLARKKDTIK